MVHLLRYFGSTSLQTLCQMCNLCFSDGVQLKDCKEVWEVCLEVDLELSFAVLLAHALLSVNICLGTRTKLKVTLFS